jgi:hypothetical protein
VLTSSTEQVPDSNTNQIDFNTTWQHGNIKHQSFWIKSLISLYLELILY